MCSALFVLNHATEPLEVLEEGVLLTSSAADTSRAYSCVSSPQEKIDTPPTIDNTSTCSGRCLSDVDLLPFSLSELLVVEFLHFDRADFALDLTFAANIKLGLSHIEWQLLLVHQTIDAMVLVFTVSLE